MDWTTRQIADQTHRVAIVTGANSGIGLDTARVLAEKGAKVVLACRDTQKAEQAKKSIALTANADQLYVMQLNLNSLQSVREFVQQFGNQFDRLDLLINNAGLMMPPYSLTADGFESQIGINYLAHFALTGLLLPLLEQTAHSRIVALSSVAHKRGSIHFDDLHFKRNYSKSKAYCQSKLACLMFAFELQKKLQKHDFQTISVAAHPGVSTTNLSQHFPKMLIPLFNFIGQPSARGALPTLYAALGDDIAGGDYCGPNGLLDFRGDPVKARYKPHAAEPKACAKLWDISETLTGVHMFDYAIN